MERYLGVDVHRDSCTFSVLSETGRQVDRQAVQTNGQALVSFVRQLPGKLHLWLEEGESSQWLYAVLSPHVAEIVVVWAEKRETAKSDALDAQKLAERLRTGRLGRVVYKAPRRFRRLRKLARVYGVLTQDVVRSKNRLKSLVRRRGIHCTGEQGETQPAAAFRRPLPAFVAFAGASASSLTPSPSRATAASAKTG